MPAAVVPLLLVVLCASTTLRLGTAACAVGQYDSGGGVCVNCAPGQYGAMTGPSPGCFPCIAPTPFSNPGQTTCYGGCPDPSWTTVWLDVGGVEGAHSCLKLIYGGLTWDAAKTGCETLGSGVHLLTTAQVGS